MTDTVIIVEQMPRISRSSNSFWTPERLVELRELLEDKGMSCREAGLHFGKSKNAISGIVDRRGFKLKTRSFQQTKRMVERPRKPRAAKPGPPKGQSNPMFITRSNLPKAHATPAKPSFVPYVESASLTEYNAAPVARKRIWELDERECKWPVGESGGLHQCCAQRTWKDSAPYCAFHARAAIRS